MIQNFITGSLVNENKTLSQSVICALMSISTLFTIAKIWKKPKYSSKDEQVSKT